MFERFINMYEMPSKCFFVNGSNLYRVIYTSMDDTWKISSFQASSLYVNVHLFIWSCDIRDHQYSLKRFKSLTKNNVLPVVKCQKCLLRNNWFQVFDIFLTVIYWQTIWHILNTHVWKGYNLWYIKNTNITYR